MKQNILSQNNIYFCSLLITILLLLLSINLLACDETNIDQIEAEKLVLVCGDSKVLLVNYDNPKKTVPKVIWYWDAHFANDLPEEFRNNKFNSIDDCKAISNKEKIMISSSSGAIAIINIKNKIVEFYAKVPNAHSIELLPGNKIISAASTHPNGNKLMLFDIDNPNTLVFSDSLYSAHGVVWDEKRNSLYALGYDVLREYKMNEDTLALNDEWKIPGVGGHDLQMAPNSNKLYITEHTGAWFFDIKTKQFEKINQFPDAENIKSLNENINGQFVYTVPEESWWTYHVRFYNPTGKLYFPNMRVYKARWF